FRNGFSQNGKYFRLRDMDLMPHLAHSKGLLIPTERGLMIKEKGRHLLWAVKNMRSNRDLRVKIKTKGAAKVTIELNRREMKDDGHHFFRSYVMGGPVLLRPMTDEDLEVKTIHVVTTEPDVLMTYFETCVVELERSYEGSSDRNMGLALEALEEIALRRTGVDLKSMFQLLWK
ncbi:hypothetical protein PMAYCL1PPCAC_13205, partial [Pristionchus mayeri]